MYRCYLSIAFVFLAMADPVARACGPFFPNAYLTYGEETKVLSMPEAAFYHELSVVLGEATPVDERWYPGGEDGWTHTRDADVRDLREALAKRGAAADEIERIAADYAAMREAMNAQMPLPQVVPVAVEDGEHSAGAGEPSTLDAQPKPASEDAKEPFALSEFDPLLNGLPTEFALYLRGAAAYRAEDFARAVEEWRRLLALPEAQRPYRSTWAAFMIGKALMKDDPASAIAALQQVRDLAAAGFADSLNLAPESLGWQALAEMILGDTVSAMHHYVDLFLNGADTQRSVGYTSLRRLSSSALEGTADLETLARDKLCRQVMTAWVVAAGDRKDSQRWQRTVAALNLPAPLEGGDRLAWAAYRTGDMEEAQQWLDASAPSLPYCQWVQSKLLLREGRVNEAVAILRDLTKAFPVDDRWAIGYESETSPRAIASAELGVLLLGRKDYVNALDYLMRSGYWMDAAYVAERVLTLEELETYVAAHAQDADLAQPLSQSEYWQEGETSRFDLLRGLLARRLARAGQWDKALPNYPADRRANAEELKTRLAVAKVPLPAKGWGESVSGFFAGLWGSTPGRPIDRPRAEALFHAGEILRRDGMDLAGTEVEPDWYLLGGNYELEGATKNRHTVPIPADPPLDPTLAQALAASPDEVQRAAQNAPEPDKRFHYRYVASDLMWQSAQCLPDNDLQTARALYWGGVYLKDREPQMADKFYKALVWRNLNLPYAQAADKKRWFPKDPPE